MRYYSAKQYRILGHAVGNPNLDVTNRLYIKLFSISRYYFQLRKEGKSVKRTIKVKMTTRPLSNGNIQVRTSVTNGNSTKSKTQTIRIK